MLSKALPRGNRRLPYPSGHRAEVPRRVDRADIDVAPFTAGGADLQGNFQDNMATQPGWQNRSIPSAPRRTA
jgi:hypothetical protein